MDTLRPQSYTLKSLELSPDAQREEGHHALRCVPLLSLKLSLPLRARGGGALRCGQGASPWTPAEEHGPSDSLCRKDHNLNLTQPR